MTNQTKTLNRKWLLALTVPAVAGLIAVGGCDDSSKTATPAGTTGTAATPPADSGKDMGAAANNTMDKAGDKMDTGMDKAGNMMDKGANDVKGMAGNDSKALAGVPQAAIDKITQMSQDAAEMAAKYKDQAENGTDVNGYGSGDAAGKNLGAINEAFDALKGGVEDRNFAEVTSSLTKLKGMNLAGDLKTKFAGIVDAMKSANIPGIDKLMPNM